MAYRDFVYSRQELKFLFDVVPRSVDKEISQYTDKRTSRLSVKNMKH